MQKFQTIEEDYSFLFIFLSLLLVLFVYRTYRKKNFHLRLNAVRNRPISNIDPQKVIVALELEELFVQISQHKRQFYQKIVLQTDGITLLIQKLKELFGIGVYFKKKMSIKSMRTMIQTLTENPKIQLFLYTSLTMPIANQILQKICLNNYFRPQCRRSCSQKYCQTLKHPTEVDQNTKRVIIVTNSSEDHLEQDSKYFLVTNEQKFSDSIRLLTKIVNQNKEIGQLHNELMQEKIIRENDFYIS